MKKNIKFISFYDTEDNKDEERYFTLSAVNKMNTIIDSLIKNNFSVEIVSMSSTRGKKNCPGSKYRVRDNVYLKLFFTFGRNNFINKIMDYVYIRIQFFFYLLFNIKSYDVVLVYHSLNYVWIIMLLKKIINFKLVLEQEEVYSDVSGDLKSQKIENKISKLADAYIFPTELLNKKINISNKQSIIIHGPYNVEKDRKSYIDDNKIHIVYAGTLDPRKGGSEAAIYTSRYLPNNYHIHILGFGTPEQIEFTKVIISELNNKNHATVSYDGLLSGEKFIGYLQSCKIGLSTQNPNGKFNDTSFPSKILTYLSNGLYVVSARLTVVAESRVGDMIIYYDEQTPVEIARTIRNINFTQKYNSREKIMNLKKEFDENLKSLIMELEE